MNPDLIAAVRLGLPILWLIVATGVALVLYRTSEALFEEERRDKATTRRIRLVGSGAIAAFAFVALMYATPLSKIVGLPEGSKVVSAESIAALKKARGRVNQAAVELSGCIALAGAAAECRSEINELNNRSGDLAELLEATL